MRCTRCDMAARPTAPRVSSTRLEAGKTSTGIFADLRIAGASGFYVWAFLGAKPFTSIVANFSA
jgi:hypothetical protein